MGNAVREFQELGYIPTTPLLSIIPRLDINFATMTGIHPHARNSCRSTDIIVNIHSWFSICAGTAAQKEESHRKLKKVHGRF
jgi:hypothetical protein